MGQGRGGDMIIKAEEAEIGVMRLLEVVGQDAKNMANSRSWEKKIKEVNSPLERPEGDIPEDTLILAQWSSFITEDFQNRRIISVLF